MPFIDISVSGATLDDDARDRLFSETTRLMHEVMGKRPEVTAIRISESPFWSIGGVAVSRRGRPTAHMDIKVTAGTNSAMEKAAMIEAGHALLRREISALDEVGYVVVHELPATDWGYGGRTQAARKKT